MKYKMMRKGKMPLEVIIGVILLIITAGILFLLWKQFNFAGTITQDICHESVVLRSTFNAGPVEAGKEIPLKCRTEKLCLSQSGDDCNEFFATEKSPVDKIKLGNDAGDAREKALETIANAFYDCHAMLGEGKLDFLPHSFRGQKYCLICSRIAFDEKAKENADFEDISYADFYKYLEAKRTPSGNTYLNFLYPGWTNADDAKRIFDALNGNSAKKESEFNDLTYEDWKIKINPDNSQGYAVIVQVIPDGTWTTWTKSAATVAGGILVAAGILAFGPVGLIGAAITTSVAEAAVSAGVTASSAVFFYDYPSGNSEENFDYAPPALVPYNRDSLNELNCKNFEFSS